MPLPGPWGALVLKTSHSQDKTLADIPQRLLSLNVRTRLDSSHMCLCLWPDIKSSSLANQAPGEGGFPPGPHRGTLVEKTGQS